MSRELIPTTRHSNKGRIIGPKPPLKPKHIWAIRQQLKNADKVRDPALFNCAIDASYEAATSSSFGSATWRPVDLCVSARPSCCR